MHHEQQIGAMLRRGQVTGIAKVIADIKRHPRSLHPARPPRLLSDVVDASREEG
jgi:hypothetical protein